MTFSGQRGGQYARFKMAKNMAKLPNARRNSYVTKEDPLNALKEIYSKKKLNKQGFLYRKVWCRADKEVIK